MDSRNENSIAKIVVNVGFQIHNQLGPGLLEHVYQELLEHELLKEGLYVEKQVGLPVEWDGVVLDRGYRADLIVNRKVIIEIKSIDAIADIHFKQVLTYLKLADLKLGLLINFNTSLFKDGVRRVVNGL